MGHPAWNRYRSYGDSVDIRKGMDLRFFEQKPASDMEWIDQNPSYKAFPVGSDLKADTGQANLGWQAMEGSSA